MRQAARILHTPSSKYNLPWQRVIKKDGSLAIKDKQRKALQKILLLEKGVKLTGDNKIDDFLCQQKINLASQPLT